MTNQLKQTNSLDVFISFATMSIHTINHHQETMNIILHILCMFINERCWVN